MSQLRILLFICAVTFFSNAVAEVTATLDRSKIQIDESVNLIITSSSGDPDLDVLEDDFTIMGRSTSSRMNIVNGKVDSNKEWSIALAPKRIGKLRIPPIPVNGGFTPPLLLEVVDSLPVTATDQDDVFLKVEVSSETVYVQQYIRYSMKLFHSVDIREGSLSEPEVENALVERIGNDARYQTTVKGKRFQVTERNYAIFPQKPGKLRISPATFDGQVMIDRNTRADPFNQFFNMQRTQTIRRRAKGLVIDVQPAPIAGWWLPAKEISISETYSPESPEFEVGQSVTRTLRLRGVGVSGEQLPRFEVVEIDGIRQYPEPNKVETHFEGDDYVSYLEQKIAILPTRAGTFTLPEVKVSWWNTQENQQQVAVIPSKTIQVKAASQTMNPVTAAPIIPLPQVGQSSNANSQTVIYQSGLWPWLSAGLAALWLATLVLWWQSRHKGARQVLPETAPTNHKRFIESKKVLQRVCMNGQPDEVYKALQQWFRPQYSTESRSALDKIMAQFGDPELRQQFAELQSILYANGSKNQTWDGPRFWRGLEPHLTTVRSKNDKKETTLPPLYPAK